MIGMSKEKAKALVAPRRKPVGTRAERGSEEYKILNWSLNQREDRDWYADEEPEAFVVRSFDSPWVKGEKGWFIVFSDHEIQFSYLKGFDTSPMRRVSAAARREISQQIIAVHRRGHHVHHDGEGFSRLLKRWMTEQGLRAEDIEVIDDGSIGSARFNERTGRSWREFHAANARLIRVTPDEHRHLHSSRTSVWESILKRAMAG